MSLASNWRSGAAADALRRSRCVLVDIGARDGLPVHWEAVGPLIDVVAFEPDEVEARRLTTSYSATGASVQVVPHAVWDAPGRQTLQLTRSPGCSSLYVPNRGFLSEFPDAGRFDVTRASEVETARLDSLMPDPAQRPFRFVKIDAQGGALRILRGASEVLKVAVGVEAEVEFAPMYQGEPLFGEVDEHMRSQGFALVDLRPTYWRREVARHVPGTRGQLVFCDALYLVAPRTFAARVSALDGDAALQLCASALLVCDVYGLPDWSAAYAAAVEASPAARRMMADHQASRRSFSWPRFPLRYPLGLWLKDLGDSLIESRETWAVAEQRLGGKPRFGLASRLRRRLRRASGSQGRS